MSLTSFEQFNIGKTNQYVHTFYEWGDRFDRLGAIGEHVSNIGAIGSRLSGNTLSEEKSMQAAESFGFMRSTVSCLRFVTSWTRWGSGQALYQKVSKEEAKEDTTKIEGTWKRDEDGNKIVRHWSDIAMDVCVIIFRTLSPLALINRFTNFLGKHAKIVGNIAFSMIAAVMVIDIVQTIHSLATEIQLKAEDVGKKIFDIIAGILDLAALPFDFGFGMQGHPVVAIIGSSLNIIANGLILVKDYIYYA